MKNTAKAPKWTSRTASSFYGVSERFYFLMEGLGRDLGKAPPWESPVKLGKWFEEVRGQGLRRKAPPASIMAKIMEAREGRKLQSAPKEPTANAVPRTAKTVKAEGSPSARSDDDDGAEDGVHGESEPGINDGPAGESDAAVNLQYLRREAFRLQRAITRHRRRGNDTEARVESARLKDVLADLRQWELSAAKIRQGDEEAHRAVSSMMAKFSSELWRVLTRAFMRNCPPEQEKERRQTLNETAEALPALMEEHFGGKGTAAALQPEEAA